MLKNRIDISSKCLICNDFEESNLRKFSHHLRLKHKKTFFEYIKEFYELPKCPYCDEKCRYSKSNYFGQTCGSKEHLQQIQKLVWKNEELKHKTSLNMKKAHEEGRAYCWKTSKEESYPEKYFREFLQKQGLEKGIDFVQEFPIGRFRADFFFPKKFVVIEIDGGQHERFNRRQYDKRKDELIQKLGYKVVRIWWRVLYNDKKEILKIIEKILKSKDFAIEIEKLTSKQAEILNRLEEKQQQLKRDRKLKKKEKRNKQLQFFKDAQDVLRKDDISSILCLKWNRTKHFVKKFFNIYFPNEWTTRATCTCGKSFKNKSGLNEHKKFCDLVNDTMLKEKMNKDYHEQYLTIQEVANKYKVSSHVASELVENKRVAWESVNLRH